MELNQTQWVDINEIATSILPMSKRKVRRFVACYLHCVRVGHRIYVKRAELEALLNNPNRENFPLNF